MARPKKEGMDYFPHDTDAVNDEKVEALRMLYGNDGYAFYFILLERIYRSKDAELDVSDAETMQILSRKVGIQQELFNRILETSLKRNCFDRESYEERGVLTSSGIKKRVAPVIEKRENMRRKYNSGPENNSLPVSDAETQQKPDKVKESKVKESKEDKEKKVVQETELFESWWNLYNNKKGRVKCEAKYKVLLKKYSHEIMMTGTKNYIDHRQKLEEANEFLPQQKQPLTFLNGEHFNDEYAEIQKGVKRPGTNQQNTPATNDTSGLNW